MRPLKNEPSRSLKEYRLLTGRTTAKTVMSSVNLRTRLCTSPNGKDFLYLNIPLMSAAMQAVSGTRLSVALAQFGGISVLPCSIPVQEQVAIIKEVKRFKAGFQEDVTTFSKDDLIADAVKVMSTKGYHTFPITENGRSHGRLLGILSDRNFDPKEHVKNKIEKHMVKNVVTAREGISLPDANKVMIKYGRSILPIVDSRKNLRYVVFKKDLEKHRNFPDELVDHNKRYMIAAAVSTLPSDHSRIDALIKAGVDALIIDSSDGFSDFQIETLSYIRNKTRKIPVIGGNIITKEGFFHLAEAGFDAVKVGMGIGSGCTTQEQKGVGRGQASALIDVCAARDEFYSNTNRYLPIISDGSISNPGQIVIALALGADSVMMGRFFAQFSESEGGVRNHPQYGPLKEFWMEASARARSYGRYETKPEFFFEEGVEGYVPHIGSIYDNLGQTLIKIKSALSNAGCKNIDELHKTAVLELQSIASLQDAAVHDIITK
ncbi:MAG: IMP dehydrogenase [Candidatus Woesearchaeota archaeon]